MQNHRNRLLVLFALLPLIVLKDYQYYEIPFAYEADTSCCLVQFNAPYFIRLTSAVINVLILYYFCHSMLVFMMLLPASSKSQKYFCKIELYLRSAATSQQTQNICMEQRQKRWANFAQMFCKYFVFTGLNQCEG